MTLQLSNKGLKIIQNVAGKRAHENYRVIIFRDSFPQRWQFHEQVSVTGEREALHPSPRDHVRGAGFEPQRGRGVDDLVDLQPGHGVPSSCAQLSVRQS